MLSVENFSRENKLSLSLYLSHHRKHSHILTHSLSLSRSSPPESVFTAARSARSAQFLLSSRDYRFVRSVLPCSCIVAFDPVCRTQPYYCSCCWTAVRFSGVYSAKFFSGWLLWLRKISRSFSLLAGCIVRFAAINESRSNVSFAQIAIPVFVSSGFRTVFSKEGSPWLVPFWHIALATHIQR